MTFKTLACKQIGRLSQLGASRLMVWSYWPFKFPYQLFGETRTRRMQRLEAIRRRPFHDDKVLIGAFRMSVINFGSI